MRDFKTKVKGESSMHDRKSKTLTGEIDFFRFQKDNFLIAKLKDGTTIKGEIIKSQRNLKYKFNGKWEKHTKYGWQFAFHSYEIIYPTSNNAIQSYLQENAKWIGPTIAASLTKKYGKDTLKNCRENPEQISQEIKGITLSKALEISAMLKQNMANESLLLALQEIFGGTRVSKRAIGQVVLSYGETAPRDIKKNPYSLIDQITGIGFLTADRIAQKIGFDQKGKPRIRAGIVHILKEESGMNGHTCLHTPPLVVKTEELLAVSDKLILKNIEGLIKDGILIGNSQKKVALAQHYYDELLIANKIKELLKQNLQPGEPNLDGLQSDQIEAIYKATDKSVFILTGAPGTGKTFTIKRILDLFPGQKIELAAPTGKAAKRMYEQTNKIAQTIHRLLEPQPVNGKFVFTRDSENPIEADVIILDECSMISSSLFARFLDAVDKDTRLILVGDTYQLPPVGPGNVLKNLLESGIVPHTELTIIKRQSLNELIIENCHRIKNGENIRIDNENSKDFFFIEEKDMQKAKQKILDLVEKRLPEKYGVDRIRDIQVIAPLRKKTDLSCKELNAALQDLLTTKPQKKSEFRIGDKVIQTKNNYQLGIINGDIGYVKRIDFTDQMIAVDFENPDRSVELPLYGNDLQLAWSITIHKMQGSENRIIIMPIFRSFGGLIMQRNLLYTAISRAIDVFILIGEKAEIIKTINRNRQQKRNTNLLDFLQEKVKSIN